MSSGRAPRTAAQGTSYKLCGLGLLAAVLLTGLALVLYRLRPSEAAGKAMAFKKTQAPIKSPAPHVPVTT